MMMAQLSCAGDWRILAIEAFILVGVLKLPMQARPELFAFSFKH